MKYRENRFMAGKDEWIDIAKSKNINEMRNTKEYKDWVKEVKERDSEKMCPVQGWQAPGITLHLFV